MKIFEPKINGRDLPLIASIGNQVSNFICGAGFSVKIIIEALFHSHDCFKRRREIGRQMMISGVNSIGIVSIVALFTGMILALQAGIILKDYGQAVQVGRLVAQTCCREMGPFMTALIISASVGSAMAAEIGTMNVSEEVSALHIMSINPCSYLIMPRLWAMIIMLPILTIYANCLAIIGGMVVAKTQLDVSHIAYYNNALSTLELKEIYVGLLKALVFAVLIVMTSSYQGFITSNGAIGVGKATRKAVVQSFLLILVTGYFITRIFY